MSTNPQEATAAAASKRQVKLQVSVPETEDALDITFVSSGKKLLAKLKDLPEEILDALVLHGLKQKLVDSAAGVDAEHCEAAITAVWDTLKAGKWSQRGEGGGGPKVSQLAEALARATKQAVDVCVSKIAALNEQGEKGKETLAQIKAHPAVKQALLEIKAEKTKKELEAATADAKNAGKLDLGKLAA